VPNGASIAVVGFLNLIKLMTGTPTYNASGSCAAHSNALLHSRAIARTQASRTGTSGNCRKERIPRQAGFLQPYASGSMEPAQNPFRPRCEVIKVLIGVKSRSDRRAKLLMFRAVEGSILGAYSHPSRWPIRMLIGMGSGRRSAS
jgi:hypothetical protein